MTQIRRQAPQVQHRRNARFARAEAVLALASPVLLTRRKQIAEFAAKNEIPAIYPWPELLEDVGLMTYGVSMADLFHRAATYVDRISRGAKPSDLPAGSSLRNANCQLT